MALQRRERSAESTARPWWPVPMFPLWRSLDELFRDGDGRQLVAVEEYTEDGTLFVRAELPGIDPEKDVEITVGDGTLHIKAERTEREEKTGRHFHRSELRYGAFARNLPLPGEVDENKIKASYKDGILEIKVPLPEKESQEAAHKITVSHS